MNSNPQSVPSVSEDELFNNQQVQEVSEDELFENAEEVGEEDIFGGSDSDSKKPPQNAQTGSEISPLSGDLEGGNGIVSPQNGPGKDSTKIPVNEQGERPFSNFNAEKSGYGKIADQVGEFINSTLRAGMSGAGQFIEGLGTAAEQGRENFGDIGTIQIGDPNSENADRSIFTNIGREIEDTAKELFPDNPEVQNNFVNTTVPEALGSTMSFAASQAVGGTPLSIINGGVQMAQSAFEDAKRSGVDDDKAMEAFFWNMPLGGLEAFPAAKLLNRFNKASGGSVTQVIKEGGIGGVEEMMQESTQQFFSNVAAQNIYDESRSLIEGIGEGGGAGFVVGAMLSSIGASARNLKNNPDASPEAKQEADKTLELVKQKKQEFEAVDPLSEQTPQDQQTSNPFLEELNFGESGTQRQQQQSREVFGKLSKREDVLNDIGQSFGIDVENTNSRDLSRVVVDDFKNLPEASQKYIKSRLQNGEDIKQVMSSLKENVGTRVEEDATPTNEFDIVPPSDQISKQPWEMTFQEFEAKRPAVEGYQYHGSPEGDISEFDPNHNTNYWREGSGVYTTDSRDQAARYAKGRTAQGERQQTAEEQGRVNYIKSKAENVFDMSAEMDNDFWDQVADDLEVTREVTEGTNMDAFNDIKEGYSYEHSAPDWEANSIVEEYIAQQYEATTHKEGVRSGNEHNVTVYKPTGEGGVAFDLANPKNVHKETVRDALESGKDVPESVLKDYPELAQEYNRNIDTQEDGDTDGGSDGDRTFTIQEIENAQEVSDFNELQAEQSESIRQPDDAATEGSEGARERGAFTTQEEKGNLDKEFVEQFKERGERLYNPLPDDATIEDANSFVSEVGLENAKRSVLNNDNKLLPRHRVAIGHKVLSELDKEFKNLKSAQDPKAQQKLDEQIEFANNLYKLGTELGRGVRAFAYHSKFSPEAHVRTYENVIKKAKKDDADVEFDQEVARNILERGKEIEQLPDGFQKEEATIDLMKYISNQTPASKTDIAMGIGYANLLSGYETQIVNFTSTALNTVGESVTLAAANPKASGDIMKGMYQGFVKGIPEAWNIIKTGKVTGTRRQSKIDEIPDVLERVQFGQFKDSDGLFKKTAKAPLKAFNAWKYVRRVMAANDVLFFKSAEEMRSRVLARKVAQDEGISDRNELSKRVNEILGNTAVSREQAKQQAEQEGLTGNNKVRRINEIIRQGRPDELVNEAANFALNSTFNQKPEGVLGYTAQKLNEFGNKVPAMKVVVPFTNVVSNVTNTMLDYTPVGLTRLRNWGPERYHLREVPDVGSDLWTQQAAKGVIGTLGITALAFENMKDWEKDNDDRDFMITGRGPKNFRKKYQLQETGWKPYSIKVGDTYISYQDTPFGLMMATIGNYHDATKYGNMDEADLTRRVSYVMNSAPQAVLDMSFLTGLSGLFTALSQENLVDAESPVKTIVDKSRAFVIPNLIKQVDQIFDPQVYTSDDVEEALIRDIPVARTMKGSPILNVLGEPIRQDYDISERLTDRFLSVQKKNPVWRTIVEKQAFISQPMQGQTKITLPDGTQRAMDPDEHYNYIKMSGNKIKRDIQLNLARIRAMPKEDAQDFVQKLVQNRRRQAKDMIERGMASDEKLD